jgi:competence protein ComEC
VLANFEVGTMYINGTLNLKPTVVEKFDKAMEVFKPNLKILSRGDSFAIGDVAVDVLNPPADLIGESFGTIAMNNTSLCLKFTYKDFSALFSGDIYIEVEYELIGEYADQLNVDLVKASHHGRNTSNSREWAQTTSAKVVVATSGNAIDEIVYANYARSGAQVFTDTLDGYVRVVSNGLDCITTTSRPRTDDTYAKYDLEARTKKKK